MSFKVTKISGHKELFDRKKFYRSLHKAGASKTLINQLISEVEADESLRTTKKIYAYALDKLYKSHPPTAARYNIKQALLQLGPAGFPFEQFIAHVFEAEGYQTKTNQIVSGHCIDHEVDVVVNNKEKHFMVECKYHNRQRLKSDVKVTLYIKARFDDVDQGWKHDAHTIHQGWVVTNTKFTSEAVKYGECAGVHLLSWNYPAGKSLIDLIHKYDLHPITALVSLNKKEKEAFIKKGFVLCKDAPKHAETLKELGMRPEKVNKIIQEAQDVCKVR